MARQLYGRDLQTVGGLPELTCWERTGREQFGAFGYRTSRTIIGSDVELLARFQSAHLREVFFFFFEEKSWLAFCLRGGKSERKVMDFFENIMIRVEFFHCGW